MSAAAAASSQDAVISSSQKTEKKHKRTKSEHKKKRAREDDETAVRKKKKHREPAADEPAKDGVTEEPKKERKKSSKRTKEAEQIELDAMDVDEPEVAPSEEAPKLDKKRKEKKLKKGKAEESSDDSQELQATQDSSADTPTDPDFPFFTQTVSLYVPFFPVGFDKPLTNIASQHLDPLLNHYSPTLHGVLLSYSNLNLSDRPAKASVTHPPTDQTPALLHSIDEYAVGFGWLTFDAHLFVPSRGKWMEGVVQLQSEGHIGVVCWNKFNASIEAKRLPSGWKWVDLSKADAKRTASSSEAEEEEEKEEQEEEDVLDGEELQVVEQIHTTGYWVNERGRKVSGKLQFRVKNFDVGLAGDYGYLSIEGTCLDDDEEQTLTAQERETERARRAKHNPAGLLRPLSRRVPEFSMTKFGKEDQEEDDGQRTVLYKGSRPGTPDD
ncbi:hypothetical protein N0V88_002619 [Collariella sp. IMI 366227]|nr:hypothetical protein N0V88_002619 [Collariella sp. IMI 366227]